MSLISRVTVKIPATTSNLGPGFDCLGLALDLHNELTLELHDGSGLSVEITGEGQETLPRDERNLIVRAARLVLGSRAAKKKLVFKALNRIPLSRGLGSSAAAVLSGLYAANFLFDPPACHEKKLLDLACGLEGHPDNVAPAIHGGLVVSLRENEKLHCYPLATHNDLVAVVCIPELELSTKKSRSVLPKLVGRETAVFNAGRSVLLAAALERGHWELLPLAMEDRLHQPYRAKLIPGFADVLRAAREAGPCGAALSGSGSTILALCRKGPRAQAIGRAMQKAFLKAGLESRFLVLGPDHDGIKVLNPNYSAPPTVPSEGG